MLRGVASLPFDAEGLSSMSRDRREASIEKNHPRLGVRRQCRLLSLTRSTLYALPAGESIKNLALMRRIDEQFVETQ